MNRPKWIAGAGPITSWQIDEETMEMVTYFIFLGSKITADGVCSHEIKRCLLLGETPRSSRDEGLIFLHGLETNHESSLQTEEQAGLR